MIQLFGRPSFRDWDCHLPTTLLLVFIRFQLFQRFSHEKIWGDNDPSIVKSEEHPQIRQIRHAVSRKRTVVATASSATSNLPPSSIGESDNDRIPQALPESSARSEEEDEKPKMSLSVAVAIFASAFLVCRPPNFMSGPES